MSGDVEQRLFDQVSQLNTTLTEVSGVLRSQGNKLDELRSEVGEALRGRGKDDPGLMVRVDRLEQSEASRKWHVRMLWTALAGGFAHELFKIISSFAANH